MNNRAVKSLCLLIFIILSYSFSSFNNHNTAKGKVITNLLNEALPLTSVLYVDADAALGGNGTSWASAYKYLQDALIDAANNGTITEIWVAEGVYYPDEDEGGNVTDNDENATFQLLNNVKILGGFNATETSSSARDPELNRTILSGDLEDNDTKTDDVVTNTFDIEGDNSYHVVTGSNTDGTAELNGFIITAGEANGGDFENNGGGLFNVEGSPTLTNLHFSGNKAEFDGGAMCNLSSSSPILTNVDFSNNRAAFYGGAMINRNSSPTLTNVLLFNNSAREQGGGFYNANGSAPTLVNLTFSGNIANYDRGGAIYNTGGAQPIIRNSIFFDNEANGTLESIFENNGTSSIAFCYFDDASLPSGSNDDGNNLLGQADPFEDVANENFQLVNASTAIDAGDNSQNSTAEDLAGHSRNYDDQGMTDAGNGAAPIIDMGAYERQLNSYKVLYVNAAASLGGDGKAWNTAYKYLQDALVTGLNTRGIEAIWVAEGVYYPDEDEAGNVTNNDEDATFQLLNNISVFGGFNGTETTIDQRDLTNNRTILSGDIEQDDTDTNNDHIANQTSDIIGNNSLHIVTGSNTDETAILDGFIITAGQANGTNFVGKNGGGMFNHLGTPSLSNLSFIGNIADKNGGGMFNFIDAPNLTNVSFSKNHAQIGGAIYNDDCEPRLVNLSFSLNTADDNGGAIFNLHFTASNLSITNSIFYGNTVNGSVSTIGTFNLSGSSVTSIAYSYFDDASIPSGNVDGGNNLFSQADPFVDAANGNLQLQPFSTAIDAGDNSQNSTTKDLASNSRKYDDTNVDDTGSGTGPIVDMGAYERQTDSCLDDDNDGICDGIRVSAKAFLQGAYDSGTGLMNDDLRQQNLIPSSSPYSGTIESVTNEVLAVSGTDAIVDWVLVELRSALNDAEVLYTRAALLQRDGDVVDVDGISSVSFEAASQDDYYISIRHRNHLGVMTVSTRSLSSTATSIDFSSSSVLVYGTSARVDLGMGVFGLYNADTDGSGSINATDRSTTWNDRNVTGYLDSDCNLDGVTNATDRSATWNNRNVGGTLPE